MSYICKHCGKEFESPRQLGGHIVSCKQNPNKRTKEFNKTLGIKNHERANYKIYTFVCEVCGKEYQLELSENSYNKGKYKRTCSDECAKKLTAKNTNKTEKNKKIAEKLSKNIPWNKNKQVNRKNNKVVKTVICKHCGKEFKTITNKKYCSDYCKSFAWKNNGGLRKNSYKQYKSGWYKGIHCDSSWELALVIYYTEHNLFIERNKQYRTYVYNNKSYKYYPDFITEEGLLEVKGYKSDKWNAKIEQNPDIKVLYKNDMKPYLQYVISKYGTDFIKLYDKADKIAMLV